VSEEDYEPHAHEGHDHAAEEHEHDHDEHHHHHHHGHDHTLIVDRLPAGRWRVDHDSSEVNFKARAFFGLLPVNGYFEDFTGEMQVAQDGTVQGSLVVDMNTVQTGIVSRDQDLRSGKYFDADGHPQMTFTLESVQPSGHDHLDMRGTLVLRGASIPLAFPVYAIAHGDHLHVEGRVRIDHHAAGLNWSKPGMVGKSVRADVALTLQPLA